MKINKMVGRFENLKSANDSNLNQKSLIPSNLRFRFSDLSRIRRLHDFILMILSLMLASLLNVFVVESPLLRQGDGVFARYSRYSVMDRGHEQVLGMPPAELSDRSSRPLLSY
jgi:hypothetical protein